jgi:uncharacterized protein (DUF433 family)
VSKTSVITLRLPSDVAREVEFLARRFGHKPAQMGARLIEESLRRRSFPQIELRDTVAGRVSYLAGTRFAVYWIVQTVRNGMAPEAFAKEYDLPVERVRAALAYAEAFAEEIESDIAHAESNREWVQRQESAYVGPAKASKSAHAGNGKHKAAK